MDTPYETALLQLAEIYAVEAAEHGGKSLARVATIVVNRGSFFERLRDGGGCSARNLELLIHWFRRAENWPRFVPDKALSILIGIGRPVLMAEYTATPEREAA